MTVDRYTNLLTVAGRVYERHWANRPRTFNVFTVLRSASDEVNLHSRFLHAVLDHKDPASGRRENLEAFVEGVAKAPDFSLENASVERESGGIDLLISSGRGAIVIENKIWAGDQERQLERYRDELVERGYGPGAIRLLYLTPFGDKPSEQSAGRIPVEAIQLVSYREDLGEWLTGCQRRAFDDPGLREAIAQYRGLIMTMTNSGYEAERMSELKELLLRGDNVVVASQIAKSLVDAETELVMAFYGVVDRMLREGIEDMPPIDPEYAYLAQEWAVRRCVTGSGRKLDSGLYYRVSKGVWLTVSGRNRLWVGLSCQSGDDPEVHGGLAEVLGGVGGSHHADSSAPWYRWLDELPAWGGGDEWLHIREPNEESLKFLSSGTASLEAFAKRVADALGDVWKAVKLHGLADPG